MTREIYLIRHGETLWNREKRFQGSRDSPLTDLGRAQAAAVGRILAHHLGARTDLTLMVSPLGRALATAAIVQAALPGLGPAEVRADLAELSLGRWEGLTRKEIKAGWGDRLAGIPRPEWYFHAPDGETLAAAETRATTWLATVTHPTIVVTHSVISRLIRGCILGLPPASAAALPAPQDRVWHLGDSTVYDLTG